VPGAEINARPVVEDADGDEKVLAVRAPRLTKRYEHVMNYRDLPRITLEQMQPLLAHYKDREPANG
jgi:inorganic pyrophosphatase